jgi:hypothetical protein
MPIESGVHNIHTKRIVEHVFHQKRLGMVQLPQTSKNLIRVGRICMGKYLYTNHGNLPKGSSGTDDRFFFG